jgi:hypothetical protein
MRFDKLACLFLLASVLPGQCVSSFDPGTAGLMPLHGAFRLGPAAAANSASSAAAATQTQVFTRVMSGAGWETSVVLLNMGSASLAFSQLFVGPDGTPKQFGVRSQSDSTVLTTAGVQATLNPNSSLTLVLFDNGSPLQEAWSLLTYDASQGKLAGYAVVRHRAPSGAFSFETTVPLSSMQDYSVHVPFDNTQGFRTQLTLVNPASNLAAIVGLSYSNPQGQVLLMDLVTLQPGQQMTISLPDTYPDLANTAGIIAVDGNINRLSVLGMRYNDGYGAIATVPVIN